MIPVARPAVANAELDRIREVFESRWLGQGKVAEQFEDAIAERCGGRPTVVVNTGTSAMHLALAALGVGPGDEVIVPSLTYVATAQAVTATGATVVLCDVNRDTMNVDVDCLEAARTSRTKVVMPVHYRGLPAEIRPILDWASDHGIRVIEDAAHAFGSLYEDGTPVGAMGDVTCFSFDPIKNVTTGEGGALVFEHQEERDRAARMRALGIDTDTWSRSEFKRPWEYDVVDDGFRYHMPNFCAAIGLSQLERFHTFRERKQAVLARYQTAFADHSRLEIPAMPVERCFPFLALVLVDERDRFMAHMKVHGVGTGVHYIPAHHFRRFADAAAGDLPVSDWLGDRICSLPLMNDQTEEETASVIEAVMAFNGRS